MNPQKNKEMQAKLLQNQDHIDKGGHHLDNIQRDLEDMKNIGGNIQGNLKDQRVQIEKSTNLVSFLIINRPKTFPLMFTLQTRHSTQ